MSRKIDLTKPLSDEDRAYLEVRCKTADLALNAQYMAEQAGDKPPTQASPEQLAAPGNPQTTVAGETTQTGNSAPPPPPPADGTDNPQNPTPSLPESYDDWTKKQLWAEIDKRNNEDDAGIDVPKSAKHEDLVAALELDDEEIAKAEAEEANSQQ